MTKSTKSTDIKNASAPIIKAPFSPNKIKQRSHQLIILNKKTTERHTSVKECLAKLEPKQPLTL